MIAGKHYLIIFVASAFLLTCGKDFENADIQEKNGVKIIHNQYPLWEKHPRVRLELTRKIGEIESEDENYMLYQPADVARDSDGCIYILDQGNFRIQKFGPDGKYVETFARKGQGPGEILRSFSMNLFNNTDLHVCDMSNQRIQVFSTNSSEKRTIRMNINSRRRFTTFRFLSTGNYVTQFMPMILPNDDLAEKCVINILDKECAPVREIGKGRFRKFDDYTITAIMNYTGYDTDAEGNIYIVYYYQNRLEKFSADGSQIFQSDRPLQIDINNSPQTIYERTLVTNSMAVDGKGRIWLSTSIKKPPPQRGTDTKPEDIPEDIYTELEIFNSEGILLGKIHQPIMSERPPLEPINTPALGFMRIFGDRIYFIDFNKEMCVYEYKIIELQ